MDFLTTQYLRVRDQLGGLSLSAKFLLASLGVIMVLVAAMLIALLSSSPQVPISGFAAGQPADVVTELAANGIEAELREGKVFVEEQDHAKALATLARSQMLSPDAAGAFDQLVSEQMSPWTNYRQGQRQFLIAKQKYLSVVASKMAGVREASVVVDMPDHRGFAQTHTDPSASVTVFMEGGNRLNKPMVAALAGLVSGAVAELEAPRVQVIDGDSGTLHTVGDPDSFRAGEAMDDIRIKEEHHRQKIADLLRNIRGVIVAVKVNTSNLSRKQTEEVTLAEEQLKQNERSKEVKSNDMQDGGEPGVRSNVGLEIAGAGATGTMHEEKERETTFGERPTLAKTIEEEIGNAVEQINVSIGVPRSYFVSIFMARNPDSEAPSDDDLAGIQAQELLRIEELVKTQTVSLREPLIRVDMVYDAVYLDPEPLVEGGALATLMDSPWASPGAVMAGFAALSAVGLMLYMVRRATRPEALPSVEELAGLPPTLPAEEDLVGEVEEVESGMEGMELDEDELNSRKIADQISEMVKANPEEAGGLVNRWVDMDE
ncbi:MAG: hypothetical protein AAF288_03870 [Planctomycetota bacterium]